ncbi:MAG: ATP-binding cassette domain-containing protein [Holosporales bacterium]|jgi:phospholipid/cholesterol/gamma-HCH transport system ATP-binding protein|nr:ATP-binding cassette domain-containing protein [Holosporales bacterium]
MSAVVEVENLKKSFGKREVLKDVSFRIDAGESYVIVGGSGTGKSVLVKCILGLFSVSGGKIFINGKNIMKLRSKDLMKVLLQCGVLYQGAALFDSLNIIDNISFGLVYGYHMKTDDAYKIAIEKLEAVNLDDSISKLFPSEISGGMKKRVALARALATNPSIIFFDEPTTGLDPINSGTINDLIVKCTKELGISALSITHDISSLQRISDRVGLLFDGSIIWEGTNSELETTDNEYMKQFISGSQYGPFTIPK